MGRIWMPGGGGGGVTSDDVTAKKSDIPTTVKTVTSDSNDEVVAGTLPVRKDLYTATPEIDNTEKVVRLKIPARALYETTAKLSTTFATLASLIGLTAAKLADGQTVLGLKGTYKGKGNATAGKVLEGSTFSSETVSGGEGTMPNKNGTTQSATATLDADNKRVQMAIPAAGYYGTASKLYTAYSTLATLIGLTAAKLATGQSVLGLTGTYKGAGNAVAGNVLKGKTFSTSALSNATGTLEIQSAINFSAAAQSDTVIRISWKNPAKGPYQGVVIRYSTSAYPGTSGGTVKYQGTGSSTTAGGTSYVDITGLNPSTLYYFTCYTYVTNLGAGTSYNLSATTQMIHLNKVFDTGNTLYARYGYFTWEEDSEGDSYFDGTRCAKQFYADKTTLKITSSASSSLPTSVWASPKRDDYVVYSFKYSPTGTSVSGTVTKPSTATLNAIKKYTKYKLVADDGLSNTSWVYEATGTIREITTNDWTGAAGVPGGLYGTGYWINIVLDKKYIDTRSDLRVWSLTLS